MLMSPVIDPQPASDPWTDYVRRTRKWLLYSILSPAFVLFINWSNFRWTALGIGAASLWVCSVGYQIFDFQRNRRRKNRGEWQPPIRSNTSTIVFSLNGLSRGRLPAARNDEAYITTLRRWRGRPR
jgi:hypothetical protein